MKRILFILLSLQLVGCAQFKNYCAETEARAALRAVNPLDYIDAIVFGGCAAVGLTKTEEKKT